MSRIPVGLVLVWLLAACGQPNDALPTRPPLPPGWTVAQSGAVDLRMALPPWIVAFDTSGAIFANELPSSPGADFIQVLAEGPRTAEDRKPAAGEPLDHWLERYWFHYEPERGPTTTRSLPLPAGRATELRTTLGAGTDHERSVILYAIATAKGVGFLAIDGPPQQMATRSADLALIPLLIELEPRP